MANKKLTQLETLNNIPANTQQLILVAVDTTGVTPITRKMPFSLIDERVNSSANAAQLHASAAYNSSNTGLILAQYSSDTANTLNVEVRSTSTRTNSAFQTANSAGTNANSAYSTANTALSRANAANTTSLKFVTGIPGSSFGQFGDKKGMVALDDSSYIYFCVNDYDGSTRIWQRANTTSNW